MIFFLGNQRADQRVVAFLQLRNCPDAENAPLIQNREPVANPPRPTSLTDKPKLRGAGSEPDIAPAKLAPARKPAVERNADAAEPPVAGQESKDGAKQESKVVSIDAFRKKT